MLRRSTWSTAPPTVGRRKLRNLICSVIGPVESYPPTTSYTEVIVSLSFPNGIARNTMESQPLLSL